MSDGYSISEEQLDYLSEMMNVGAGNAATALSQILRSDVELEIPQVHLLAPPEAVSILGDPTLPSACVRMSMVGDVQGDLYFIVPEQHRWGLAALAQEGMMGYGSQDADTDLSAIQEIGNMTAGVYLSALYDFCRLRIHHTVPAVRVDMIQSLLDESLVTHGRDARGLFLIENVFISGQNRIRTFFLMIPFPDSMTVLLDSIASAKEAYATA